MKKNGFTLIEMLVIIILIIIIVLITVPLILNTIEKSKRGAFLASVYGIIESAEYEYANFILSNKEAVNQELRFNYSDGEEEAIVSGTKLDFKGEKPRNGSIIISPEGKISLALSNGIYCAKKDFEDEKIIITENLIDCEVEEVLVGDGLVQKIFNFKDDEQFVELEVNGETYNLEVYKFEEDVTFTETPTLCNNVPNQTMCVLVFEKNLTIEPGVIITPQTQKKGFTVIVKKNLINKGTITMTARGATAPGQNVYLWENSDGSFEFVPAAGAAGGSRVNSGTGNYGFRNPNNGVNATNRATGGGGSGAACSTTSGQTTANYAGAGSAGTSYSGGSGGSGARHQSGNGNAQPNGGAGGTASGSGYSGYAAGGGAGNPGGNSANSSYKGQNGTGGLLIIYTKDFDNQGTISSNGSNGGYLAGNSGGGSVNIFYKNLVQEGTITANGGVKTNSCNSVTATFRGGNGTVTLTPINFE